MAVAEGILLSSMCRCSRLSTQCCTEAMADYRSGDWARAFLVGELAMTLLWISDLALLEVILPETTGRSPHLLVWLAWARRKEEPARCARILLWTLL